MGRKNRRSKQEYRDSLGFNPRKYITPSSAYSYAGRVGHNVNRDNRSASPMPASVNDYRSKEVSRGDIWFAELGDHPDTSIQNGCRPVLVLSNDVGNHYAETFNVVPMTTRHKKMDLPSHILIEECDLKKRNHYRAFESSMILAEQITTIAKTDFRSYIGTVTDEGKLAEIEEAVRRQLAL